MSANENESLVEKQLSSTQVYSGRLLQVYSDVVELPDGNQSTREYIKHLGAVCIVAVTDEGNVIMEHQYRYPVKQVITEIPAGKLDYPDEDRLEAAKRELMEETGITADHWVNLGHLMSTPAYTQEDISMYLATGLHKGNRHLDDEEFLEVYEMPLKDAVRDIMNGTIFDGKTIAAILKAEKMLQDGQESLQ